MNQFEEIQPGFVERQMVKLFRWLVPSEGLLSVILTLAAVFCSTAAVIDATGCLAYSTSLGSVCFRSS